MALKLHSKLLDLYTSVVVKSQNFFFGKPVCGLSERKLLGALDCEKILEDIQPFINVKCYLRKCKRIDNYLVCMITFFLTSSVSHIIIYFLYSGPSRL